MVPGGGLAGALKIPALTLAVAAVGIVGAVVIAVITTVETHAEGDEAAQQQRIAIETREDQRRDELQELLAHCSPLAHADPYKLGVSRSSLAETRAVARQEIGNRPMYVHREAAERQLRECFSSDEPFVLVYGTSKAGKSRTLSKAKTGENGMNLPTWPNACQQDGRQGPE
jgi:hypothetical protein